MAPRRTILASVPPRDTTVEGAFLYIPTPLESAPHFSLRVRDTSINATSVGTQIPVVRREDAKSELVLIDIPADPGYRATLRIYGWTPAPMPVTVQIFVENLETLVASYEVVLNGILTTDYVPFPPHPAYLALDPIPHVVKGSGARLRIEITNHAPLITPPPPPIWAFVSITNNETQQVTVVTPK